MFISKYTMLAIKCYAISLDAFCACYTVTIVCGYMWVTLSYQQRTRNVRFARQMCTKQNIFPVFKGMVEKKAFNMTSKINKNDFIQTFIQNLNAFSIFSNSMNKCNCACIMYIVYNWIWDFCCYNNIEIVVVADAAQDALLELIPIIKDVAQSGDLSVCICMFKGT